MNASTVQAFFNVGASLGGALIGALASLAAAMLTFRNERRKFSLERIWDARREAYTQLVAMSAALERLSAQVDYEFSDDAGGEAYYGSPRFRANADALHEMHEEFRRLFTASRLVVSDEMAEQFEALDHRLEELARDPNLLPPEEYQERARAYKEGSREMLTQGQKEIAAIR